MFSKRFCVNFQIKNWRLPVQTKRSTNICSIEVVLYTVIMYIHVLNVIGDLSTVASHSITTLPKLHRSWSTKHKLTSFEKVYYKLNPTQLKQKSSNTRANGDIYKLLDFTFLRNRISKEIILGSLAQNLSKLKNVLRIGTFNGIQTFWEG